MIYVALAIGMLLPLALSIIYIWVSFAPEDLSQSNEPSYWDDIEEHIHSMKERLDEYSIERNCSSDFMCGIVNHDNDACTRGR